MWTQKKLYGKCARAGQKKKKTKRESLGETPDENKAKGGGWRAKRIKNQNASSVLKGGLTSVIEQTRWPSITTKKKL